MKLRAFPFIVLLASVLLAACGAGAPAATSQPKPQVSATARGLPAAVLSTSAPADTSASYPNESAPVLMWHREGGIAGYCDDLTVNTDGSYIVDSCAGASSPERSGWLTADQQAQLNAWVDQFQSFDTSQDQNTPTPAPADALLQTSVFTGNGTAQPSADDLHAIDLFAGALVSAAGTGGTDGQPHAVSMAIEYLAGELNIPLNGVTVTSLEKVVWPDRCLGVTVMGQMCAMGVTPGYKIVLQAQGQSYELHTNDAGDSIRQVK